MFVQRVIVYPSIVLAILLTTVTCYAQSASWLKRSWQGRAYLLGPNAQSYKVILVIQSVKGKNFEGIMRTIQPGDTSAYFDTKLTGFIRDRQLVINIGTWKVNCSTCKPQTLGYSIESGRFFLKGEAKGCSVECTWITEFSDELDKFNTADEDMLYAMADEEKAPEEDTTALAQNTRPQQDTISSPPEVTSAAQRIAVLPAGNIATGINKAMSSPEKPLEVQKSPSVAVKETAQVIPRIAILPAGGIIASNQKAAVQTSQKPPGSLDGTASMSVKQSTPVEKRIAILPAGDIISSNQNAAVQLQQKPPGSLDGTASLSIKESTPIEKRITILPAGDVTASKHNADLPVQQNPPGSLEKNLSMTTQQSTPVEQKIAILPAGSIVASERNTAQPNPSQPVALPDKNSSLAVKQNTVTPKKPLVSKDTVAALPEGYAERKKNVVRTLIVNTDSILLRVYDNGVVDGDIASVIYNDKVVVDKLSLTSHAREVKIPVNKSGMNTLVFHAHNLGELPPNTAILEILYGNKREELTVASDLTVSSVIDIEYKQ